MEKVPNSWWLYVKFGFKSHENQSVNVVVPGARKNDATILHLRHIQQTYWQDGSCFIEDVLIK